ncbi:cation:proton antiporter [uncultured Gemella sp.]|uniref:cation:proton antiporter n=1 Tax=uncultured Gemella sp. TaxID=254352 RepID=UPI0028D2C3BA|nr:cation:proton antiporter [uncultured Gemella sp.]
MEILTTLGIFVIIVILGSFLNNLFPRIPAALFQIILGAAVTFIPNLPLHFEFESEMFMMLVIAPLLFTDGFNSSLKNIWLYKRPIIYMAIFLVLVTVIIVGSIIHLLLPMIPWAACFVLAAVLSPTDAVAVKSITKGMKLPKGLMAILEGESLLNDASGLVSFNIALAAVLTNTFSVTNASYKFLVVAGGGAIFGLIIGITFSYIKFIFSTKFADEFNILVIFQLITPVIVFYLAEHIGVSGIVAVVITALVYNYQRKHHLLTVVSSDAAVTIDSTQQIASYVLNGFVFTFLGYLLPEIYHTVFNNREIDIVYGFIISLVIVLGLMIVRLTFVYFNYISFQPHHFTTARKTAKIILNRKFDKGNYSRFNYSLITSLCGIHGTVTLATALMIPVVTATGDNFPLRNTILFIASNVVLLSIIIGTIALPLVVKNEDEEKEYTQYSLREKILEGTLEELKERDISKKSIEEKVAYAFEIKSLHELKAYFKNMQTGRFKNTNEPLSLHKKIMKAQDKVLPEILKDNPNIEQILEISKLMQLRKSLLFTYSIPKNLLLNLRIYVKESNLKRRLTRHFVAKDLTPEFYEKLKEKIPKRRKVNFVNKLDEIKQKAEASSSQIQAIIDCSPTVRKVLLETAYKVIDEKCSDQNTAEFVKDVYKYYSFTLFEVFLEDIDFEEELKELQMELVRLLKYRILTMRKLNYISLEDSYTALRNLNFSESMIFPRETEEE